MEDIDKRILNIESLVALAMVQIGELGKQTKQLEQQQDELLEFTKTYTNKITDVLGEIKKIGIKNGDWAKEFHRLIINEYAQYSSDTKAFAILYSLVDDNQIKRISLMLATDFQRAQAIGEEILRKEQEDPKRWVIDGWQQLDIPTTEVKDVLQKVDQRVNDPQKPIGVFLNDLQLIKDKFATSPTERATLTRLINKIDKKHNGH